MRKAIHCCDAMKLQTSDSCSPSKLLQGSLFAVSQALLDLSIQRSAFLVGLFLKRQVVVLNGETAVGARMSEVGCRISDIGYILYRMTQKFIKITWPTKIDLRQSHMTVTKIEWQSGRATVTKQVTRLTLHTHHFNVLMTWCSDVWHRDTHTSILNHMCTTC